MAGELGRPEPKVSQGNPEPGPEKDEIRTREWNIHNLSFFGGNSFRRKLNLAVTVYREIKKKVSETNKNIF